MPRNQITISRQELINLKREYTGAVNRNDASFVFQGQTLLTAYAKYLIQYLDGIFNK
jgi:ABC-type lipoprotein export system ATPase subunit